MTDASGSTKAGGIPLERLHHLADTKRGIDDPRDVGYYECCAMAEELLRLRLAPEPPERQTALMLSQAHDRLTASESRVAELRDMLEKAVDHSGVSYDSGEDEIGARVCCGVLSYKPHEDSCWVLKARAILAKGATE